ncbi:PREDICTED: transport and Golgi organization protein 6 homolog isoform X1 [Atta colombica]|uniref:transport and Golgi organization protein 6 homolog isoform X1 n=1 Tax=Atta colombica TaxID=520822 RepID=UPI00084CDB9D|nr:PREDICTED: transport and Golgi organization protein 6 homolog isoform X1 [Atta colombica]
MDYNEILSKLIYNADDQVTNFDDKMIQMIQKVKSLLPKDMQCVENLSMRQQYLNILTYILRGIKKENINVDTDASFNVNQYHSVKIAVEFIILIGIKPFLLPGVGIDIHKLCPIASTITEEKDLNCLEKYERLCFSTHLLLELYDDLNLRPIVLLRIGFLMAALLQLSHAPLAKPVDKVQPTNLNNQEFQMTTEEYQRLQNRQKVFHTKFISLLSNCPRNICFRELMTILGMQNAPKWLRKETQNYLIKMLMQPNGVSSLIATIYNDNLDLGMDWRKLDTFSRLIAVTHGKNIDEYYKAVCPQILDMFSSDRFKHSSIIANCCIKSLYDYNPHICQKYIIEVICAPLTMKESQIFSEKEIEWCINILAKCFLTEDSRFKHVPCKVILYVATPLFCLYDKIRESACILKTDLRRLLLKIFEEETLREKLYSAFLGHDKSVEFGNYITSEFASTGGIEITGLNKNLDYEKLADTIFDLVSIAKDLSPNLFCYMLKFLLNINKWNYEIEQPKMLETEDDKIERITMQLAAHKLLSQLASTSIIQDAQIKNPEPLLSFIKSLFNEYIKKRQEKTEESECEMLYISLILIKMILLEKNASIEIVLFKDFKTFLEDHLKNSNVSTQLKALINEVVACITTHNSQIRTERKYYQDLSSSSDKFDQALRDLADSLLPIQAHGLVVLTKLIETKDAYAVARNAIILRLFEENLKHEDSFIYLASINGLCALATAFPEKVIEILMLEYIDMPKRTAISEITVETRIKLGEILVKTTKALGEMSVVQKNILLNGFLCAIRDADPLVRASGLSCLGELCKVLNYRLGNVLTEILYCITCILKSDKVPECRRAAVLVATLLFRGLDRDLLSSCTSDMIDLYRELRNLRDDKDPVLQLHVQLAFEEIDRIMRDLLTELPTFRNRIS